MQNLLEGKNAFITGAGAGIGRAIALEMSAQGANIYFADSDRSRCTALQRELDALGARAQGYLCDVSQTAAIDEVCAALNSQNTIIDILVNCVGITSFKEQLERDSFANWQKLMDTNVLGPLYFSRKIAHDMIENGIAGNLIFITSLHQWHTFDDEIYSASKAGVGMIIKELAVSLSPHGIRVNGIAPGSCQEQSDDAPAHHAKTALYHQTVPPRYIARAALFLASDYFSHHTTGATLVVDGGLSLYSFASQNIIAPPPDASLTKRAVRRGKREWKQLRDRLR